ncbi:DUF3592 domain-containing protein [Streptomyces sp. NPDC050095]|uniref:DUF3592 domain-containing protein n=1 Tax=unclassified Streptomyces TaxID=2593676 RepID=UPI0034488169
MRGISVRRQRGGGRDARWWFTCGGIAFGALFLGIGLLLGGSSASMVSGGEHARGIVVDLEWSAGSDPVAHPVVAFTPAGGEPVRFTSSMGSSPPAYDLGERVDVLYRADDPGDAQIDGFVSLWLLPLVFGGAGLVILVIALAFAVARRRRSRAVPGGSVTSDVSDAPVVLTKR